MDILSWRQKAKEGMTKYRAVLIVILAGFLLMAIPKRQEAPQIPQTPEIPAQQSFQENLEELLSHLEGAGKVRVLLTEDCGSQTLYQSDEDRDGPEGGIRKKTVVVSGREHLETGLIRQINPPRYRGAVILSQGADRAQVRLSITEAVSSATGLTSDKITVLKMK